MMTANWSGGGGGDGDGENGERRATTALGVFIDADGHAADATQAPRRQHEQEVAPEVFLDARRRRRSAVSGSPASEYCSYPPNRTLICNFKITFKL